MIERICRALCVVNGFDPDRKFKSSDWGKETAPHELAWHEWQPEARAVLLVMRDASEKMLARGGESMDHEGPTLPDELRCRAQDTWQAMIDVAIEEQ